MSNLLHLVFNIPHRFAHFDFQIRKFLLEFFLICFMNSLQKSSSMTEYLLKAESNESSN